MRRSVVPVPFFAFPDRFAQAQAIVAEQRQHAQTTVKHIAVEKSVSQQFIMFVRRAGALMHVLRDKKLVQRGRQRFRKVPWIDPVQEAFLGRIERIDNAAVMQRQRQTALLEIDTAHRLEHRRFEREIAAQGLVETGEVALDRAQRKNGRPRHRNHSVPGRPRQQQDFLTSRHRTARLRLRGERGVECHDQCRRGDRPIAFAESAEQRQHESRADKNDDQPGAMRQAQLNGVDDQREAEQGR